MNCSYPATNSKPRLFCDIVRFPGNNPPVLQGNGDFRMRARSARHARVSSMSHRSEERR